MAKYKYKIEMINIPEGSSDDRVLNRRIVTVLASNPANQSRVLTVLTEEELPE